MNNLKFKYSLQYNKDQQDIVKMGRSSDTIWGNVDDLDPKKYTWMQMYRISLGRGSDTINGNIDDLNPSVHSSAAMHMISLDRGYHAPS